MPAVEQWTNRRAPAFAATSSSVRVPSTLTRSRTLGGIVVAVERGDVDDGVAAGDDPLESRAVEEVDPLVDDLGAPLPELAGDVAADEAGRPADVDPHSAS